MGAATTAPRDDVDDIVYEDENEERDGGKVSTQSKRGVRLHDATDPVR
jgi:hypothetical protein